MELDKGDIVFVQAPSDTIGNEMRKDRYAIVISPTALAKNASRALVVPLTSNLTKIYPHEARITSGVPVASKACCDQIRSISTERIVKKHGAISDKEMQGLNQALINILQLQDCGFD